MSTPPLYNEKEVLLAVAEGDENAFRQLFNQWKQVLAGYVFRITESREMTEEIVQDVFLKIWMAREALFKIENFKHYLIVVSRNQSFDFLKKRLKEEQQKRDWEINQKVKFEIVDDEPDFSNVIDAAIESLPPRRKEVYLLSRHNRLTYQEIADQLGISKESVKTHLKLATKSLSAFIQSRVLELIAFSISIYKIF